ncbi:MAG: sporulation integral membrane protein YlbJ [Desulfitobacteriaceae bacterium]
MLKTLRPIPILILAIAMFSYPQEVLASASTGISLWWRFVLPALLPFFILSELLMGMGFVHFLGVLVEPLMRPLFGLPGKAAFVVAMGYTSGFPMGAVLTARLRQEGEITKVEGERLLAFTNNPSPGFIFGAVASGLLGKPGIGLLLASSVYLSNLLVGLLFRFYGPRSRSTEKSKSSLRRAWQAMLSSQAKEERPLGTILGQAVRQSVTTVLTVGGYIVFFAVILRILTLWNVTTFLAAFFHLFLGSTLPSPSIKAILDGLLEMTLGCQGIVEAFSLLNQQIAGLALIMGWGGLSVFAQIAGFISETDLRFSPFVLARSIHALLALGLSQIFWHFTKVPATNFILPVSGSTAEIWLNTWHLSSWFFIGIMAVLIALAFLQKLFSINRY